VLHVLVSFALLGAFLADIRAQLAELSGAFTSARHHDGRGPADLGAFQIENDATRERVHVWFPQAGRGAVFAFEGALIACIDANAHGFVGHRYWLRPGGWERGWQSGKEQRTCHPMPKSCRSIPNQHLRLPSFGSSDERSVADGHLVNASVFKRANFNDLRAALDSGPWSSL
jgi:hypothetical protein